MTALTNISPCWKGRTKKGRSDLGRGVSRRVAKFSDDTTLFNMVKTKAGCQKIQEDLHKLGKWETVWKFSVGKF